MLSKFEILDGGPVKGEKIPIRLYLSSINMTPTYKSVNNRFSSKYFIYLNIIDEDERRYFK